MVDLIARDIQMVCLKNNKENVSFIISTLKPIPLVAR